MTARRASAAAAARLPALALALLLPLALIPVLAGCAQAGGGDLSGSGSGSGSGGEARPGRLRAPAAEAIGAAQPCILTATLRQTIVHDDHTVDFHLSGGRIYRNTLPRRCITLGLEGGFSYEVTAGQLCAVDTIRVVQLDGTPGNICRLGPFTPVRLNSGGKAGGQAQDGAAEE